MTLEEIIWHLDKVSVKNRESILAEWSRKYPNVPPGTRIPMFRRGADGLNEGVSGLWKFVPAWARDPKTVKGATINARSETVREKPTYRNAWKQKQRCLIPASGWYEFPRVTKGRKQPVYFSQKSGEPLFFAGIWDHWERRVGPPDWLDSFAILTCTPNETVAQYHDRMPVIVALEDSETWLDPATDLDAAYALLQPGRPTLPLNVWPVTPRVGRVDYQEADAHDPITPEEQRESDPQLTLFLDVDRQASDG